MLKRTTNKRCEIPCSHFSQTASEHGCELGWLLFFCPGCSKHKHICPQAQGHGAVDRCREFKKVRRPEVCDPWPIDSPHLLFSKESYSNLLHFNSEAKLALEAVTFASCYNSVFITFMRYLVNSGFIIFNHTIAKITEHLNRIHPFFVLNKQNP